MGQYGVTPLGNRMTIPCGTCLVLTHLWGSEVLQTDASGYKSVVLITKHFAHHTNKPQGAGVTDPVIDPVGVFARGKNTFVPQDGKVLGNVALGGADLFDDLLHADFLATEGA